MKRSSLPIIALASIAAIGVVAVAGNASKGIAVAGDPETYRLVFNKDSNVLAANDDVNGVANVAHTELGNAINVTVANYAPVEGAWGKLSGYLFNEDAVNGIQSVSIETVSGSGTVDVVYGNTEWATDKIIAVDSVEHEFDGAESYTFVSAEAAGCAYFGIQTSAEIVVKEIVVTFTCTPSPKAYGSTGYDASGVNVQQTKSEGVIYTKASAMAKADSGTMILKDIPETAAHYSFGAKLQGTSTSPVTTEINQGVVAYYLDANNYLVLEAQYRNWDRPSEIRSFVLAGKIDGNAFQSGDDWSDGNGVAVNVGGTLTCEVTTSTVSGTTVAYTYSSGAYNKSGSFAAAGLKTKAAKVGFTCYNDIMKVTNVSFNKLADPKEEVTSDFTALDGTPSIKQYSTGEVVYSGGGWKSGFAAKDIENGSSYTINARMEGTIDDTVIAQVCMGFLVYYADSNNFLIAYCAYETWDRPQEIRELQMTGMINGADAGWVGDKWCDGSGAHPAEGRAMEFIVTVTDTTITTSFNMTLDNGYNKTGSWVVNGTGLQPSAKAGLWGMGDTITYSNINIG